MDGTRGEMLQAGEEDTAGCPAGTAWRRRRLRRGAPGIATSARVPTSICFVCLCNIAPRTQSKKRADWGGRPRQSRMELAVVRCKRKVKALWHFLERM